MNPNDTPYTYGLISKILHWTIALIVIGNLAVGWLLEDMQMPGKLPIVLLHKSFGTLVLILMIVRFTWRQTQGFPKLPDGLPAWQKHLAHLVHVVFYPVLILMPVVGWLMSSAAGYPVMFFGLFNLPMIWEKDKAWAELFGNVHALLGYAIAALVVMHVGAALWHHFVERTKFIKRMM